MAGGDEFVSAGGDSRALGAILFLAAGTNVLDVYSAVNSSPWTVESFGADPEKAKAVRKYVAHGAVVTSFFCVVSAVVAHSWWPIFGAVLANIYMMSLYAHALKKAQQSGSTDWE